MSATSSSPSTPLPSSERIAELHSALCEIRNRVASASKSRPQRTPPTLVAVSKYKPAADVLACYDAGQRDFGENYAQELVEKAALLPRDVRWHFIGTVQSNKAKTLAGIENLYAVQTLTSTKLADLLNRHRPESHPPLRVLIQLNTSGEQAKGGIPVSGADEGADGGVATLATHVVRACPRLRLVGLMTIGAAGGGEEDFAALRGARERLVNVLPDDGVWGEEDAGAGAGAGAGADVEVDGLGEGEEEGASGGRGTGRGSGRRRILLSMGMSNDFELAVRAGADVVRVGMGIFGARPPKKELEGASAAEQA